MVSAPSLAYWAETRFVHQFVRSALASNQGESAQFIQRVEFSRHNCCSMVACILQVHSTAQLQHSLVKNFSRCLYVGLNMIDNLLSNTRQLLTRANVSLTMIGC